MLVQLNSIPTNSPIPDDVDSSGRHAVDAPLGIPVVVADGDAEPAVVGSDDVDEEPGFACDLQSGSFAGVGRQIIALPLQSDCFFFSFVLFYITFCGIL